MKKKLTLSIDEDAYEDMGEIPRKISMSEIVTWLARAFVTDVKGMSDEEFRKYMDSDPSGKEVRKYLQEKLLPIFDTLDAGVESVKKTLKPKKEKK